MYCKHCGGYRHGPCEDCHNGECTMNCGPAMVDVRGIFDAADAAEAEIRTARDLARFPDQRYGMHQGVRLLMRHMGLLELWKLSRAEQPKPPAEPLEMTRPGNVCHEL